jgi:transposase
MRNDHRMGGNISEPNRPHHPSNNPPDLPDNQEPPEPAEAAIPGLDVHDDLACPPPKLQQPRRGRRLARPAAKVSFYQRLLILDAWRRSGLPAGDFAPLVGLSKHTLYLWKQRFDKEGPAALADHPRGAHRGSRLSEVTRRAIVMLKEVHPAWGCQRISDALQRGPALSAYPAAVAIR